jgi:hypothetical protein
LEQSKNAVLNSLASASSQESYGHAIEEFVGWYCSEPRLAFNRTVVLRYRFFLEQKKLAPDRQGKVYPTCSSTGLGEATGGRLDLGGGNQIRNHLPSHKSYGETLG